VQEQSKKLVKPSVRAAGAARSSALADVATHLVSTLLQRFGECRLRVSGKSMFPAIRPADILLIRAVESPRIAVGDVVLFARAGCLIAHRVVETRAGANVLITRGDANSHHDAPVTASRVIGRVEGLLRNGTAVAGPVRVPSHCLDTGVFTRLCQRLISIQAAVSRRPTSPTP
jgi:signal peptidase I